MVAMVARRGPKRARKLSPRNGESAVGRTLKTTYDAKHVVAINGPVMSEASAETVVSFYGARGKIRITTITFHAGARNRLLRPRTLIRYAYTPLVNRDSHYGWKDCAYGGMIRVPDFLMGVRRQVEQELRPHPAVHGYLQEMTDMSDGGALLGRRVVRTMLRRVESLIEHNRRAIRNGFGPHIRDRAIRHTHETYRQSTARSATILGTLQWPLLLKWSGCSSECLDTIGYTTAHTPAQFLDLDDDHEMDVEPLLDDSHRMRRFRRGIWHGADMLGWQQLCAEREAYHVASTARAVELMRSVCCEAAAEQFNRNNQVTLAHEGYEFVLSPDRMILCRDPNGKWARLCIHTRGFCCHPVDEIIIAYLNIRYRFDEFMRTANVFQCDPEFRMPVPKVPPRLVRPNCWPRRAG
jgi:hypothetical protein